MNRCTTGKILFLSYSFIGGKILSDWVSLYGNAAMFNRNFSDLCITGAVIASSFLVWTGSYSLHYLWCNDSIQMEKSDQVESELWVLIRSSCSMKAESLSLGLKTSKHKFLILKSILNLWDINAEIANFEMQTRVCFIINESKVFIICCYWEKNNTQAFYLLFPYESAFFFLFLLALNIFPEGKPSTDKILFFQRYFSKFWFK